MVTRNDVRRHTAMAALEATVASAGAGFVCLFSSADEYEDALISERRAQGRYGRPGLGPAGLLAGLVLIAVGVALVLV